MTALPFEFQPNEQSSSPLYLQLAEALAKAISEGRYKANEALPSERTLAELLSVSRVTARNAIDHLVSQGLIVRRRGSGNYIAPRLEQPLTRLSGFSEELHQRGFVPGSRWLSRGFAEAAPDEQHALDLGPRERIARLERLRRADDTVMAYEISILPVWALPDPEAVKASLYEHLARTGNAPVRALQHIRAMNARGKLSELLAIPSGTAVLFITRIGYVASGKAVELTHSYCRSDYYDFVAEMRRE
ncbi:MAG: GntR family transcriptional regulator [Burkholderiales bacterium]|nr:GntR family transcriptional regulator [Pseudomonadota bacterium]MCC7067642.1 GntR family transcriptional regulator [Burkholderiales bacterium]MCZ2136141.1 GntR family transcriptional regulator [Burkholderiales bacterium]